MARIRTVKPEFWSHPITGKLDDAAKCMAIALLNLADDEGYFYADPATVRSFCRPFDDDSKITLRCLQELSCKGYLEVQEHPQRGPIGHIAGFLEHQRVDKPRSSNIKGYFLQDDSTTIPRTFPPEGKGKEGNRNGRDDSDFNPTEAARFVTDELNLSGQNMMWLCTDAVEKCARQERSTNKLAAETIVSRWKAYESEPGDFKIGLKRYLEEGKYIHDKSKPAQGEVRGADDEDFRELAVRLGAKDGIKK